MQHLQYPVCVKIFWVKFERYKKQNTDSRSNSGLFLKLQERPLFFCVFYYKNVSIMVWRRNNT